MSSNYGHYPPESKPILIVKGTGALSVNYRWVCNEVMRRVDNAVDACDDPHEVIQKALLDCMKEHLDSEKNSAGEGRKRNERGLNLHSSSPDLITTPRLGGI